MDLNEDGNIDILTGKYFPGEVSWFKGSKIGFKPAEYLSQIGSPSAKKAKLSSLDTNSVAYWKYTTVGFGDVDFDGDLDMFVGGDGGLRVSKNTGTKEKPFFQKREPLKDIRGKYLYVYKPGYEERQKKGHDNISGLGHTFPYVFDWDKDGIQDLLVTSSNRGQGEYVVNFFKGVKKDGELSFQPVKPLFIFEDFSHGLGSDPGIGAGDINNDGINDLVISFTRRRGMSAVSYVYIMYGEGVY